MSDEPSPTGRGRLKRACRSAVTIVLLTYVGVCCYACGMANRLMFQPQPASYADDPGVLKLETSDGERISAVYLANPDAEFTILYSHGNAEDLGDVRPFLYQLRAHGFAVFAYDYRGYGTSDGAPSEQRAYRDVEAAYAYLTGELGVAPGRVIVHGRSLGGGPACYLAAREPVGGLVLQSAFVSAFRVVTRAPVLPFDRFRNLGRIGDIDCPVLIIHGTADEIIAEWHGRKLFTRAREPKRYLAVEGARHNDPIWRSDPAYWDALASLAGEAAAVR